MAAALCIVMIYDPMCVEYLRVNIVLNKNIFIFVHICRYVSKICDYSFTHRRIYIYICLSHLFVPLYVLKYIFTFVCLCIFVCAYMHTRT